MLCRMNLSDRLAADESVAAGSPPNQRSAVDRVADELREIVLSMQIGQGLPSESKLAATFGVSRPVVREALGSLRAVGLVASAMGKGWHVVNNRIGSSLLLGGSYRSEHLNEVRLHLEVPSAGYAAERHQAADLVFLRQTLETESSADTPGSAVRLDGQFHIGVARASGNPLLERVIEYIRAGLEEQSRAVSTVRGRSERAVAEHWAILDAIGARDVRGAEEAMRAHLAAVSDAVCSLSAPRL
jgi:DNA-binding FadR family transcriptional regulator